MRGGWGNEALFVADLIKSKHPNYSFKKVGD